MSWLKAPSAELEMVEMSKSPYSNKVRFPFSHIAAEIGFSSEASLMSVLMTSPQIIPLLLTALNLPHFVKSLGSASVIYESVPSFVL